MAELDTINALEAQIRQRWGQYGEWDTMDINRAHELARLLAAQGVTNLGQISATDNRQFDMVDVLRGGESQWTDQERQQVGGGTTWTMDGRDFGFLGDINRGGDLEGNTGQYAQPNDLVGWSATGHGYTNYGLHQDPTTGEYYIAPDWGSSRQNDIRAANTLGTVVGGGFAAGGMLGGGAGGGAAAGEAGAAGGAAGGAGGAGGAAGGGAAGGGLSSAELAALYGDAGYGAGMTGGETAAYGAGASAGGAGGAGSGGAGSGAMSGNSDLYAQLGQAALQQYFNNRARNDMLDAGRESNELLRYMYEQNRSDNAPLMALRNQTLPRIQGLMDNPGSITSDPGYQFGLSQGTNALNRGAAARGMTYSGAQQKALTEYGQDYAGTKLNDSLNRLMGVAGLGQVGAAANQQNNSNYAQNAGNNLQQMGNVRGSSYMNSGNIWGNALGNWYNNQQYRGLYGDE